MAVTALRVSEEGEDRYGSGWGLVLGRACVSVLGCVIGLDPGECTRENKGCGELGFQNEMDCIIKMTQIDPNSFSKSLFGQKHSI